MDLLPEKQIPRCARDDNSTIMLAHSIRLIEASAASVTAALEKDHHAFSGLIGARIPKSFPPDLLDDEALRWTLRSIAQPGFDQRWGMYWIIAPEANGEVLVGTAGFKGAPSGGSVELGYGVVAEYQRRGHATAAVRALLRIAFADPVVERVTAETLPDLVSSIGVLEKCGFRFIGNGSEPGVIAYRIDRSAN
jgi:RimJ/RimL family protein N-acetyltransferase